MAQSQSCDINHLVGAKSGRDVEVSQDFVFSLLSCFPCFFCIRVLVLMYLVFILLYFSLFSFYFALAILYFVLVFLCFVLACFCILSNLVVAKFDRLF